MYNILYFIKSGKSSYNTSAELFIKHLQSKNINVAVYDKLIEDFKPELSSENLMNNDLANITFDLCIIHKDLDYEDLYNIWVRKSKKVIAFFELIQDNIIDEYSDLLKKYNNYYLCEIKIGEDKKNKIFYPIKDFFDIEEKKYETNQEMIDNNFKFIYAYSSFEEKNHLITLIKSFLFNFSFQDKVTLLLNIKNFKYDKYKATLDYCLNYFKNHKGEFIKELPNIITINTFISENELKYIYNLSSIGLFLNSSLENDLSFYELEALGKPCISQDLLSKFYEPVLMKNSKIDLSKYKWLVPTVIKDSINNLLFNNTENVLDNDIEIDKNDEKLEHFFNIVLSNINIGDENFGVTL